MDTGRLKEFLDEKVDRYNNDKFIETDPILIPKQFVKKEDIEIAAFLTSVISWGNRKSIINNAKRLMDLLENDPFDFVMKSSGREKEKLKSFVHRTFNGSDCIYYIKSLKNIYNKYGGLQRVFEEGFQKRDSIKSALLYFYSVFFEMPGERTRKHIGNVSRGAAAKRLNMFLRWMVRKDSRAIDFGLWRRIPSSKLMLPLDVHSGNVARKLNILDRKQNDWKAVEQVTANLVKMDPNDPIKYDYALFGLGVFEKF